MRTFLPTLRLAFVLALAMTSADSFAAPSSPELSNQKECVRAVGQMVCLADCKAIKTFPNGMKRYSCKQYVCDGDGTNCKANGAIFEITAERVTPGTATPKPSDSRNPAATLMGPLLAR